jgi:hypothetical protein
VMIVPQRFDRPLTSIASIKEHPLAQTICPHRAATTARKICSKFHHLTIITPAQRYASPRTGRFRRTHWMCDEICGDSITRRTITRPLFANARSSTRSLTASIDPTQLVLGTHRHRRMQAHACILRQEEREGERLAAEWREDGGPFPARGEAQTDLPAKATHGLERRHHHLQMHRCTHTHTPANAPVHAHTHTPANAPVHAHTHTPANAPVHAHTHTSKCTGARTHTHQQMHRCTHTHTHQQMHRCTHTHTHQQMHRCTHAHAHTPAMRSGF